MFDKTTLKPQNQYKFLEKEIATAIYCPSVKAFLCSNNSYRFVFVGDRVVDKDYPFISCLIISSDKIITSVYTKPSYRRRRIAKQLLLIARLTLGNVVHGKHFTDVGRLWRNSVEGF